MKPIFEVLMWVTFAVTMVVAPVAWFRSLRAKSRTAYWTNTALFVVPIVLIFLFAKGADLVPALPASTQPAPGLDDVFGGLPMEQRILLGAAALIWIGGGNLLLHFQRRRIGKKWWQVLNPLDPPFKDFNRKDWFILAALAAVSMGLGMFAMYLNHAG